MTIDRTTIATIASKLEELASLPAPDPPLTKRAAVAELAEQIEALTPKYSLAQIAEIFCGSGLDISPGVLGRYLRTAKSIGKKRKQKLKKPVSAVHGPDQQHAVVVPSTPKPSKSKSEHVYKTAFPIKRDREDL